MDGKSIIKKHLEAWLCLFITFFVSTGNSMTSQELNRHLPSFSHSLEKELIQHQSFDGLKLKVLRIGPANGEPVIALTGYASNLGYYLPTAAELAKAGKTVYLFSPRGLGAGIFQASQTPDVEHRFNLQSMSSDLHELMKMVSQKHPNQKIISMGHSLGGIINRLAAMGITAEQSGHASLSQHRRSWYYNNVKLQVFASSPAPIVKEETPQSIEDALKFLSNSVHQLHYRKLLKPLWGLYLNVPLVGDLVKAPLDRMGSKLNNFHELIDSRLLKTQEFKDFVFHGVADRVPTELMLQLYEMVAGRNFSLETKEGPLDVSKMYLNNSYKKRPPLLLVGTESDFLAKKEDVVQEFEFLKRLNPHTRLILLPGGHMNSVVGKENVQKKVGHILKFEEQLK